MKSKKTSILVSPSSPDMKFCIRVLSFSLFALFLNSTVVAQNKTIDSLRKVIKVLSRKPANAQRDTNLIAARYQYGEMTRIFRVPYWDSLAESSKKLAEKYEEIELKNYFLRFAAFSINNSAFVSRMEGHADRAIKTYHKCLELFTEIGLKESMAITMRSMASVLEDQGNIQQALDLWHKALKLSEELNDKKQIGIILNDMGIIYNSLGDSLNSLRYHRRSLKLKEELKDLDGIASSYGNIGSVYKDNKIYEKAQEYFEKALALYKKSDNKNGLAATLNNLGTTLEAKKLWDESLIYYKESLALMEEAHNMQGQAILFVNIADVLIEQGNYTEAATYAAKSMKLAKELGYPDDIKYAAIALKKIYKKEGKFKESLEMHELYIQMKDSIENETNRKALAKKYFQVEYERQAQKDSIANATKIIEQQFKHDQAITEQRMYTYGGIAGFILMLAVAGLSYVAFRNKKKANIIITEQKQVAEKQKMLIEEKQKEILDSIHYAQRIQYAILAKEEEIEKCFPESFLLYKPKDIVAGDFYFFEHTNDHVFYAAADCTGHGVPGALVSVVCSNALSRCVKEFEISDPGKILDKARELVLETFRKSGQEVKDGMDISLLVKNMKTGKYKWAGANNPLWYLKGNEMHAIKANKQPIGLSEDPVPFTSHSIPVDEKDTIFLFTDGMADQFGGPNGKKFKYKQISELLINVCESSLKVQKQILEQTFKSWKGELEQVDDVCVIGIRA